MIYFTKAQVEDVTKKIEEIIIQDKIKNWYKQEWFKSWLDRAGGKYEDNKFQYNSPVIINIRI